MRQIWTRAAPDEHTSDTVSQRGQKGNLGEAQQLIANAVIKKDDIPKGCVRRKQPAENETTEDDAANSR